MKKFIGNIQRAANKFSAADFAIFKIYMLCIGILVGAYFASFWMAFIYIVWAVAILAGAITIFRLLKHYQNK